MYHLYNKLLIPIDSLRNCETGYLMCLLLLRSEQCEGCIAKDVEIQRLKKEVAELSRKLHAPNGTPAAVNGGMLTAQQVSFGLNSVVVTQTSFLTPKQFRLFQKGLLLPLVRLFVSYLRTT